MNCVDAQALTDVYALDALAPEMADELEAHLETCPICRRDLAEAAHVARLLEVAVPLLTPPDRLRDRILATARADLNPSRGMLTIVPPRPAASRRSSWRDWLRGPRLAAAAALIPLLLSGWLGLQVLALQQEMSATRAELSESYARAQTAADVISQSMRGGTMTRVGGTEMAPNAWGTLYYVPDDRNAVLVAEGLPTEPAGKQYQIWLLSGSKRLNGGMLYYRPDDGRCMAVTVSPIPLNAVDAIGVTLEPTGGSDEPRGQRYLWANMEHA